MQIKVRVKTNDNENVEEWWPADMLAEKLGVHSIARQLGKTQDFLGNGLIAQADTLVELISYVIQLQARIRRLERILAKNGTPEAIELRSQLIGDVNKHGAKKDEEAIHCPHCGEPVKYGDGVETPPIYCDDCGVGWEKSDGFCAGQGEIDAIDWQAEIIGWKDL